MEGEKALAVFGRIVGNEDLEKEIDILFRENRDVRRENIELKDRMNLLAEKLDQPEKSLVELKQKQ